MKFVALLALAFLSGRAAASQTRSVTPVLELLKSLQEQVKQEGKDELATWNTFKQWCISNKVSFGGQVETDQTDIAHNSLLKSADEKESASLARDVENLEAELSKYQAEEVSAEETRSAANKLFEQEEIDLDETVKAVGESITALQSSKTGSFLQSSSQLKEVRKLMQHPLVLVALTKAQRKALFGKFDTEGPDDDAILEKEQYAKNGNTYTFKSDGVVGLLRGLKTELEDKQAAIVKEETAAAQAFSLASAARKETIAAATKTKGGKTTNLASTQEELAADEYSITNSKEEMEDDTKTLSDIASTCHTKEREYKERDEIRTGEMAAMMAATAALSKVSGITVKDSSDEAAVSLLQLSKPKPMEKGVAKGVARTKAKVVNLLRQRASQINSKELSQFSDRLSAKIDGPLDESKGLVQKMIFRLMAEQTKEDTHKLWCDKEIVTSRTSAEDKNATISSLQAGIAADKATVAALQLDLTTLSDDITKITESVKELTALRNSGKKENKLAIQEAVSAQAAIAKASAVLRDFYKDSGMVAKEPWEFLQVDSISAKQEPASWSGSYTGTSDPSASGGVLTMLEEVGADFSKMEADTRAQEHSEQVQFDKDMADFAIDKADKNKQVEMKNAEVERITSKISIEEKKRKITQKEADSVEQYLKDLEPACISTDSTYEERKAKRDSEIAGLKEAQKVLEDAFKDAEAAVSDAKDTGAAVSDAKDAEGDASDAKDAEAVLF
jgi:hypothetical protein